MQRTVNKKPIIEPEACAGCRFFQSNQHDNYGYCRRFPPTPIIQEESYASVSPVTHATEWCGEFSRALNS